MNDDTPDNKARRSRRGADAAAGQRSDRASAGDASEPSAQDASPPASPTGEDPDAALQRLESMGGPGSRPKPLPPAPAARETLPRPSAMGTPARPTRSRPRPAATTGGVRVVARIAAPVVFLVAVIALVSIVVQSGVIGGSAEPTPSPTPKVTKTKAGQTTSAATKKYTVKSGDTLSGIAAKFGTTVSDLEALNPDLSSGTLVIGDKILVPTS